MKDRSNYAKYLNEDQLPQIQPLSLDPVKAPLTHSAILGPFYRPGSPWTRDFVSGSAVSLLLSGRVVGPDGGIVSGALVEFWQANADGVYDEYGPGNRGIQEVDPDGSYQLRTVIPGCYDISPPGAAERRYRCPHIHAKIWLRGRELLTTQLYFPDDEYNLEDAWFDAKNLVTFSDAGLGLPYRRATFDFVVDTSKS